MVLRVLLSFCLSTFPADVSTLRASLVIPLLTLVAVSARSCIQVALQLFGVVKINATFGSCVLHGWRVYIPDHPTTCLFMLASASGALLPRSAPFQNCRSHQRTPLAHHIANSGVCAAPVSAVSLAPDPATLPLCIHGTLDVYAVSDLHCDYPANLSWVHALPSYRQQPVCSEDVDSTSRAVLEQPISCCIVAGDISDDLRILR